MQNFLFENMKDVSMNINELINSIPGIFQSQYFAKKIPMRLKTGKTLGSLFTMLLKSTLKIADKESDLSHQKNMLLVHAIPNLCLDR